MSDGGAAGERIPCVPLNVRYRKVRGTPMVIGYEHALELSGTAVDIWRMIDGTATVDDIAGRLAAEYAVTVDQTRADTGRLLVQLADHGLVEWAPAS